MAHRTTWLRSALQLGVARLFACDAADMAALDATFAALAEEWPTIDFVVHAIVGGGQGVLGRR
ncbi:SDR family oxidoreductase, partial [Klebsiella pneumoniae]|uniref:SDR family oxidoreductase n=1 Tax=Klebsiella pneumoniae TaxID=573 RepID=UPI002B1CC63F